MSRPNEASEWPPQISAIFNPKWVQRPTTRAKGWMVRRGTLPNLPYPFNFETTPGAFNKRLSLQLSVLTTKIPVACVGVLTILSHALKFSHVPLHGFVAGMRGSLCRNSPLLILQQWHPRALHCLRAYQLPKLGSALPGNSPSMLTWRVGAPGSLSEGRPCPVHCPRGIRRPGPRISGSPVPTTLSWPPMGPWPTAAD